MINELRNDIIRVIKKNTKFLSTRYVDIFVLYLLYLKHLCDKNIYKYEEVINNKELYDIIKSLNYVKANIKDIQINSLLRNISLNDTKELTLEFINSYERLIPIYDEEKERIFVISNHGLLSNVSIDLSVYDPTGLTTYIINNERNCEYFKALDEILNVKNSYLFEEDIDFKKYNYLCIYDTNPKYRFIKDNNEYELIYKYLKMTDNIVLYSKYSKISNFKDGRRVLKYLKTVILNDDKAVLLFKKDSKEVSIINYDVNKINSINKLKKIISNNRKQKDVLVKTSFEEIINNNSRIGFSLYELDKNKDIKDINKIVDENTRLLNGLNRINETVEEEINKLLNR